GKQTPIILSLVYVGGAVLASKRSRYDDLLTAEFDEQVLAERLQRQHKLICAAVHAGRIEDLKRLSQSEAGKGPSESPSTVSSDEDETVETVVGAATESPIEEAKVGVAHD